MLTSRMMLRHLGPGLAAIGVPSVILLLSDLPRTPRAATAVRQFRVALLQIASQPIMEDDAAGVIAGLQERGIREGRNLQLARFNAEGDMATSAVSAGRSHAPPRVNCGNASGRWGWEWRIG